MRFRKDTTALLLGLLLSTFPRQALAEQAASRPSAIVVEMNLSVVPISLSGGQSSFLPNSELLVGYRRDRVILGLGLEFGYLRDADYSYDGLRTLTRYSILALRAAPTVQFTLLRSSKQTTELFLLGRGSIGMNVEKAKRFAGPTPGAPNEELFDTLKSHLQMGFRLGCGLRYWAHPNLSFDVQAGLHGDNTFYNLKSTDPPISIDKQLGVYLAMGFMGAF